MPKQIDPCMICESLPCTCGKPSKPKPRSSLTTVSTPLPEPTPTRHLRVAEAEPVVISGPEAQLRQALQALDPLLSYADRAKFRKYISPGLHPEVRKRLLDWRRRNGD